MEAKEKKALLLTAIVLMMLVQPAFARGGGFGGGFGTGFGGTSHGFGGFGVHGFNASFSGPSHGEEKTDITNGRAAESKSNVPAGEKVGHGIDDTKPEPAQQKQPNTETAPQVVANTMSAETVRTITQK